MKKYSSRHVAPLMIIIFFPAWGMEDAKNATQQAIKAFSFIRKAMNKDLTQKTTDYKHQVREKIEYLKTENIIKPKDYQYTQNSKLKIMDQFLRKYPHQVCPELKLIITNINNSLNRKDFIIILPKLKTENHSSKNYLIDYLIELVEKKVISYNTHEINLMHNCLEMIRANHHTDYQLAIEKVTKIINLEDAKAIAKINAEKIRSQQNTIKDLEIYKRALVELIVYSEDQKVPQNIINDYYEKTEHIDLMGNIDKQLIVNYADFTIPQLYDYLDLLMSLREKLQDPDSLRYQNLDQKFNAVNNYINLKQEEKVDPSLWSRLIGI